MKTPIISALTALAFAAAAGSFIVEYGTAEAYKHNLTNDVANCRTELTADLSFTGGHRTQAVASAEVAACKVSQGTVLSIRVAPGGYDYTIVGTSNEVPGYTATMDTAAGGAIVVTSPAA